MIETETRLSLTDSYVCATVVCRYSLTGYVTYQACCQTMHLVLLYSGRNAHIFGRSRLKSTGTSIRL